MDLYRIIIGRRITLWVILCLSTCLYLSERHRLFFLRHVLKLQQDAGCASAAPKTDEVMEDDSDEELTGRWWETSPEFFKIFQKDLMLKFLHSEGYSQISKRFGFLLRDDIYVLCIYNTSLCIVGKDLWLESCLSCFYLGVWHCHSQLKHPLKKHITNIHWSRWWLESMNLSEIWPARPCSRDEPFILFSKSRRKRITSFRDMGFDSSMLRSPRQLKWAQACDEWYSLFSACEKKW